MYSEASSAARAYWDEVHRSYSREEIQYDDWLVRFEDVIRNCSTPVIDLGCGSGNDTKFLLERGKAVIACDYSEAAAENMRKNFPEVTVLCFDMTQGLPFPDACTALLVADLSLHYFSEAVTAAVLGEIKRVLMPDGILLLRVNSVLDVHHGAGQGTEVERHYYRLEDGRCKRFFDESDIYRIFREWDIRYLQEDTLTRYEQPKVLWTVMCGK